MEQQLVYEVARVAARDNWLAEELFKLKENVTKWPHAYECATATHVGSQKTLPNEILYMFSIRKAGS